MQNLLTVMLAGLSAVFVSWQTFFLKEKLASLSGDDFDILDGNNNPAFKMQASALSLTEKRVLKNAQNQPVCSLKKKVRYKFG